MTKEEADSLIQKLTKYTIVPPAFFDMVYDHYDNINALEGDIVECGVWTGGMSIFLAKLFSQKNIWVADSFIEFFQDPDTAKYFFEGDPHQHGANGFSLEVVKENFATFDALDENRVKFLDGYVVNTLDPTVCPIEKIALLRIDVDAYSATMEVLDYLYPKVVPGGYIIFDDICLHTASQAIMDYFDRENIPRKVHDSVRYFAPGHLNDVVILNGAMSQGSWIVKGEFKI